MKILSANPYKGYSKNRKKIIKTVTNTLESGTYIFGEQVRRFEEEFSIYIGTKYSIGVANGTDAIHLAIRALNLKNGDEILTVSHTAVATVSAILLAGCKPKFIDIEEDYYTIDIKKIEKSITKKTKAIIPVHLYGHSANMREINRIAKKNNLFVIEDCSQSHGSLINDKKTGTFGNISCFSFYPTKNLGCYGDGGMLVTNNKIFNERLRLLREYGWKEKFNSISFGINSRLDELQASILRIKLKYLDKDNYKRNIIAKKYYQGLKDLNIILPKIKKNNHHVFHLYVIRVKNRNYLKSKLEKKGIITSIQYPLPIHRQKFYKSYFSKNLNITNKITKEILSLPMYPELQMQEVEYIIKNIREILK